jgi:hypothetical protein
MNEMAIKRPDKTNPKDHTRTKGNTYVDVELLSAVDALEVIQSNTLLERVAALTRDQYGRQVGQVVTSKEMAEIKYEIEKTPRDIQFFPKQDFDDTIMKVIVR